MVVLPAPQLLAFIDRPGRYRLGWRMRDFGDQEEVVGMGSILDVLTDSDWQSRNMVNRADLMARPDEVISPSYAVAAGEDQVLKTLAE
jgi:hypothetical protein